MTPVPSPTPRRARPVRPSRPGACASRQRALSLALGRVPHSIRAGGTVDLQLRTAAGASIVATLEVQRQQVVIVGKGRHRHRVVQTRVVYHVTRGGRADKRGAFTASLRLAYHPTGQVVVKLMTSARLGCRVATRVATLTLLPPSRPRSRRR